MNSSLDKEKIIGAQAELIKNSQKQVKEQEAWKASSKERHAQGKAKADLAIAKNKNTLRFRTTRKTKNNRLMNIFPIRGFIIVIIVICFIWALIYSKHIYALRLLLRGILIIIIAICLFMIITGGVSPNPLAILGTAIVGLSLIPKPEEKRRDQGGKNLPYLERVLDITFALQVDLYSYDKVLKYRKTFYGWFSK